MLQYLKSKGYRGVTMGECMGEPEANWYRTSGDGGGGSTTPPPTSGTPVSTDGSCGSGKATCAGSTFGNCCSQYVSSHLSLDHQLTLRRYGWCGSSTDHCGTGCNSVFGTCSGGGSTSPAPAPVPAKKVSTDGTCGTTTCAGSAFGNCCSQYVCSLLLL
jgi:hypothetical protein